MENPDVLKPIITNNDHITDVLKPIITNNDHITDVRPIWLAELEQRQFQGYLL